MERKAFLDRNQSGDLVRVEKQVRENAGCLFLMQRHKGGEVKGEEASLYKAV